MKYQHAIAILHTPNGDRTFKRGMRVCMFSGPFSTGVITGFSDRDHWGYVWVRVCRPYIFVDDDFGTVYTGYETIDTTLQSFVTGGWTLEELDFKLFMTPVNMTTKANTREPSSDTVSARHLV